MSLRWWREVAPWLMSALCVGLVVLVAVIQDWALLTQRQLPIMGDLEIYRGAVAFRASGQPLYDFVYIHPVVVGLGFTYPPFAALVMEWMLAVPLPMLKVIWLIVSQLVAGALAVLLVRRVVSQGPSWLPPEADRSTQWAVTSLAVVVMLLSWPFIQDLGTGQVSLFVVALAFVDAAGFVPARWRGILTGVAAAVKLTPLIFLPYFLLTRQWRVAALASGTFLACGLVAFAAMPQDSLAYWTDKLWQTSRVGLPNSPVNLSLRGLFARGGIESTTATVLWLLLGVGIAAVTLWQARRHHARGETIEAALLVGCASLVVSPITWPHHSFWPVLAGLLLVLRRGQQVWAGALVLLLHSVLLRDLVLQDVGELLRPPGWWVPAVSVAVLCVIGLGTARPAVATRASSPEGQPTRRTAPP